jgi:hypothetical protein
MPPDARLSAAYSPLRRLLRACNETASAFDISGEFFCSAAMALVQ